MSKELGEIYKKIIDFEQNPDKVINKTITIYTYKFPNNSIYCGYYFNDYGLEKRHNDHCHCSASPLYSLIKLFPDIKPTIEIVTKDLSLKEIYHKTREIFDAHPNMKILNYNLYLYGY